MYTNNNEKLRYPLATASRRFIARFLDSFICSLLSIGIYCGLILWITLGDKKNNHLLFSGMFFLSTLLSFLFWFIYFIVISYFWKGYTLWKKVFKIKTHELINHQSFFVHLIKKEFFIWGIIFLIIFILSIALFSQNNPIDFINNLLSFKISNYNKSDNYVSVIFQFLFILSAIPAVIITIHLAINSKKRALHDYFSDTCVISIIPIKNDDEPILNIKKYNVELPGLINEEVLGELDE